jgi:aspartyl/asparaginyl-tRNA synthetase
VQPPNLEQVYSRLATSRVRLPLIATGAYYSTVLGDAFLAQSPQLAKQMCIAADFERVFEVGPVFRAENSLTHRHLTEFVGLDLEMAIEEHYHEVVDLLDETLKAVFRGLRDNYHAELELVRQQFPVDDFKWREGPEGTLKMSFKEAVDLLVKDGVDRSELDDIRRVDIFNSWESTADPLPNSTVNEKRLGSIVKRMYDTDYFIVDEFPLNLRPFYTMPDPTDPVSLACSLFLIFSLLPC